MRLQNLCAGVVLVGLSAGIWYEVYQITRSVDCISYDICNLSGCSTSSYTKIEDNDVLQITTEGTLLHSRISDEGDMPKHVGAKIQNLWSELPRGASPPIRLLR